MEWIPWAFGSLVVAPIYLLFRLEWTSKRVGEFTTLCAEAGYLEISLGFQYPKPARFFDRWEVRKEFNRLQFREPFNWNKEAVRKEFQKRVLHDVRTSSPRSN